ncbi:hypothetical protein HD806DRAFT_235010 [Xylariaceae sp. AK1471]|nr:hypothetical protein HD806DRAFT_235010 [Xylariaceae sp. AK1471]
MAFTQRGRRSSPTANTAECNSNSDTSGNKSSPTTSNNTAGVRSRDGLKRQRSRNDDNLPAACDQCRSRKVRCDRQQPECSNCRKAGGFCSWSSTFRRVNHTKQLRDDFSSVMDRLDEVHHTLNELANITQQIVARPHCHGDACGSRRISGSTTVSTTGSGGISANNSNTTTTVTTPGNTPSTTTLAALRRGLQNGSHFLIPSANDAVFDFADNDGCSSEDGHFLQESVTLEHGGERIFGSTAYLALIRAIARQVADMSVQHEGGYQEFGVQVALQRLLDSFPFEGHCAEPDITDITDDGRPISTPPRLMVDLFLESFLSNINASTPIFDEGELRRAVDEHYAAEEPVANSPWALIFTNIVVLGLGLEAQAANVSKSHSKSMHHELMSSFLRNCDRAIVNLDSFTRPSVVNIQALLTLALVGKEFYGNIVFEKVCQTTCHLGRIVGLHRSRSSRGDSQGPDSGNRERLFKVLYAMDKHRVFLTGHSCDLYLFDSDIQLGDGAEKGSTSMRLNSAFDHIMRIWEELYLTLYSTRASVAGTSFRAQHVSAVMNLLDSWTQQHGGLMEPANSRSEPDLDARRLELKYCYHITQVLALRCDRRGHVQKQMLDHSRACLRVIADISNMPVTTLSLASIARMLQNYPIVPFTELLRFYLHHMARGGSLDEVAGDDVELLRYTRHAVQAMQHPDLPKTYLGHLQVGMSWSLQVLEAIGVTKHMSPNPSDSQAQSMPVRYVDPSSSRPSSHAGSVVAMPISSGLQGPNRGSALSSSISSSSEKEQPRTLGEAELTSFGLYTPLADPTSIAVGHGSSATDSLCLNGAQFDTTVMGDQSWDMDLWKELFPS